MKVLIIQGSRRARSNTAAIARFLQAELERRGTQADICRVPRWNAPPDALDDLIERSRGCDAVVLAAPSYLDQLPAVLQRALEELAERRGELRGAAPRLYGLAHSGFPEEAQRRAELRSMELFAVAMGWVWMGGVGFGGTSPIDGRPLEETGMFGKRPRQGLPRLAAHIAAGEPVSASTAALCARSPFPLPLGVMIKMVNARTRKTIGEDALSAQPYAPAPPAEHPDSAGDSGR